MNIESECIKKIQEQRKAELTQIECECDQCHTKGNAWTLNHVYDSADRTDVHYICNECLPLVLTDLAGTPQEMRHYVDEYCEEDFWIRYIPECVLDTDYIKGKYLEVVKAVYRYYLKMQAYPVTVNSQILTDYLFDDADNCVMKPEFYAYAEDRFVAQRGMPID